MERIHHICRCINKQFTFKEWCEWLKWHDSNEIQFTHNGFSFNIFDVCLTPKTAIDWENKLCRIMIETAQSANGRWSYGLIANFYQSSSLHGASYIDERTKGYSTEKECIYDALLFTESYGNKVLSECMGSNDSDYPDDEESNKLPKNNAIISQVRNTLKQLQVFKDIFNPRQLSLFEI